MELCGWCDEEFEYDDWIEAGEPECEGCNNKFCSRDCHQEHMDANEECAEIIDLTA